VRRASWRIGAQAAGLLVAVLAVMSSLVVLVVLNGQKQQTTAVLIQAISETRGGVIDRRDGDDSSIRRVAVAVTDEHGTRIDGAMPRGLPDRSLMAVVARTGRPDQRRVELDGMHYVIRTARHGDVTVQAVLNLHEQREEIARLLQAIVIGGGIGVLLVAVVAVLLGRRAVRPLADALVLQQRFVADAAHELRTPLTLLSTRAQLLSRRIRRAGLLQPALQSQLDDGVRGLVNDAANLTEILEDLLLAADRSADLPQVPVDIATLADEAVSSAAVAARSAGIDVALVIDSQDQDSLRLRAGSRPALLRAVNALIDNAVSHAASQVIVRVRSDPGHVEVDVIDDGPGIDAETLPTIFDRFASQRPADPVGHSRRHYGLGLALVSDVAARHGGAVTVVSRDDHGGGAVFRLRLPIGRRG
jgi:signal transduction histidine kinase